MELQEQSEGLIRPIANGVFEKDEEPDTSWPSRMFPNKRMNYKLTHLLVCGGAIGLSVNEVVLHVMVKKSVDAGEAPWYTSDMFFLILSLIEVVLAPFISWMSQSKRAKVFAYWYFATGLVTMTLLFLPYGKGDTDVLCQSSSLLRTGVINVSARSVIRLVLLSITAVITSLARVVALTQGVAELDDHKPHKALFNIGIFFTARAVAFVAGPSQVVSVIEERTWLQVLMMSLPFLLKAIYVVVVARRPLETPEVRDEEELGYDKGEDGFFQSVGRVISNKVAVVYMIIAGLFTAGIWGFSIYNTSMMEVKYSIVWKPFASANFADITKLYILPMMAAIAGYQASKPLFDKLEAMKSTVCRSIVTIVLMIVLMYVYCEESAVRGLQTEYNQPQCSMRCGCTPTFDPMCHVNEMVTYLSPCHAGCSNRTTINGITTFTNCLCAPQGQFVDGACSNNNCASLNAMHQMIFIYILVFGVLAIATQVTIIMKSVDRRDKSTALGVTFSLITLIAFIAGHLAYIGLTRASCARFQEGKCMLYNASLPITVGSLSIGFIGTSLVANIVFIVIYQIKMR